MFHDQGHIPVKLLGFQVDPQTGKWQAISGVNITLGLPILRTSVDHGTAFDIAGQGIADAMVRLMTDAPLRKSIAARARQVVAERYSLDSVVTRYLELMGLPAFWPPRT